MLNRMNLRREANKQPKWKIEGKRRLRAKKKAFIIFELGGKCSNCPSTQDLEVHHPNGDRKYRAGIVTKSWNFIIKEIKRCKLMCRSCNAGANAKV